MNETTLLQVSGLKKAFGGLVAVNDIDFQIKAGEVLGVIGPNGSGKSTLLNLITGETKKDAGAVKLNGNDISAMQPHQICRNKISRTFQLVRVLPTMTVEENVMVGLLFGSERKNFNECRDEIARLLSTVDLGEKSGFLASQLTYIDKKRLELARALANQPILLLLDEWLAGLNPSELEESINLVKRLQESGITLVIVEHVMHAIRSLCDRIFVMNLGQKIVEGTPDHVLSHADVVSAYLGDESE